MAVIFKTFDSIEIDGIASGNIVDVISNHGPRRVEVLAAYGVYVAALQTEINASKVSLEAEKATLTTDLATRTTERDSLQSQVTSLTTEKESLTSEKESLTTDKATLTSDLATRTTELETATNQANTTATQLAAMTTQRDELLGDKATLTTQVATLQAKVADLEQYRPYNPRILKGESFYNRVSKEDMVTLLTSEDPQLVLVGKTIDAYRDNKWPVILDSTDFQQLVGYVLASRVFDQAEVDAVMKDASREEAYTV